jgi:hypothetical protein
MEDLHPRRARYQQGAIRADVQDRRLQGKACPGSLCFLSEAPGERSSGQQSSVAPEAESSMKALCR